MGCNSENLSWQIIYACDICFNLTIWENKTGESLKNIRPFLMGLKNAQNKSNKLTRIRPYEF